MVKEEYCTIGELLMGKEEYCTIGEVLWGRNSTAK